MQYFPPVDNLMCAITYGSHLYGTNSSTSDFDFKAVYLPTLRDLMLAKQPRTLRYRFDEDGNSLPEHATMPANGYEAEHTPIQKFISDYLGGQAYAVETVFAVVHDAHHLHQPPPTTAGSKRFALFEMLCLKLASKYLHSNVNGMVGFAVKQTFDYVHRGERLNAARAVYEQVNRLLSFLTASGTSPNLVRLDTPMVRAEVVDDQAVTITETVLDQLVRNTGLEIGSSTNQNKVMRTLKLNGREYLETTTLPHLLTALEKLINQYGERSTKASETDVDWKSLSHAVRVYQQVIELLETHTITFPRRNADFLLEIKQGKRDLDEVRDLLRDLDDKVNALMATTTLPPADDAFRKSVEEEVLLPLLEHLYAK